MFGLGPTEVASRTAQSPNPPADPFIDKKLPFCLRQKKFAACDFKPETVSASLCGIKNAANIKHK